MYVTCTGRRLIQGSLLPAARHCVERSQTGWSVQRDSARGERLRRALQAATRGCRQSVWREKMRFSSSILQIDATPRRMDGEYRAHARNQLRQRRRRSTGYFREWRSCWLPYSGRSSQVRNRLGNRMARTTLRLIWSRPSTVLVKLPDGGGGMGPVRSESPSTDVNQGVRRIPYYLVLRAGHECYVLDVRRDLIRRGASQLLKIFARRHSAARPIDGAAWDAFSSTHEFSAGERATRCMFS